LNFNQEYVCVLYPGARRKGLTVAPQAETLVLVEPGGRDPLWLL